MASGGPLTSGSGQFPVTDAAYLLLPDNPDTEIGAQDFCVECQLRFTTTAGTDYLIAKGTTNQSRPSFAFRRSTSYIQVYMTSNGTSWDIVNGLSVPGVAQDVWQHFALCRNGTSIDGYLDGAGTNLGTTSSALHNQTESLEIGQGLWQGRTIGFGGWIDEFRISVGTPRYTGAFTPPTAAFTMDAYTKSLLHFNGVDGSTTFNDEAGLIWTQNGIAQVDTAQYKF